MLSLTTSNRVTFSVNVSGTASTPSVRCLVGEYPTLSFPAVKLANGEWEVMIDLPKDTKPGAHPFKIEVLLNGRLFTPINYSIAVNDEEPAENPVKPIVSDPKPVPMISKVEEPEVPEPAPAPAPKPVVSLMKSMEQAPAPKPAEKVAEKVVQKDVQKVVNKDDPLANPSLWKMQEQKVKPAATPAPTIAQAPAKKPMGGLEKLVKTPVSKLQPRVVESKPVPAVKISMLDVANEADKSELKKPAKKPAPVKSPTSVQESRAQSTPVSIKKGPVIYK